MRRSALIDRRASLPLDRIWFLAMPAFYLVMGFYGATAFFFPINAVKVNSGIDRAQIFGALIGATAAVMLVGAVISVLADKPHLEWAAITVFLTLMGVYMDALYQGVLHHEPNVRPGSAFLPILFAIFPFTRWLAILRDGRMRWTRRAARRFNGRFHP